MLIKLGNIGKVFCMNGFPGRPEKRDIKREETKVEIWPSHILFTAYNRTFITVCIELECWQWATTFRGRSRRGAARARCVIYMFIFYSCQCYTYPAIWGKVWETWFMPSNDGLDLTQYDHYILIDVSFEVSCELRPRYTNLLRYYILVLTNPIVCMLFQRK